MRAATLLFLRVSVALLVLIWGNAAGPTIRHCHGNPLKGC